MQAISAGRRRRLVVLAAALVGLLGGCGSAERPAVTASAGPGFPVTIEHELGTTTIPAAPRPIWAQPWPSTPC